MVLKKFGVTGKKSAVRLVGVGRFTALDRERHRIAAGERRIHGAGHRAYARHGLQALEHPHDRRGRHIAYLPKRQAVIGADRLAKLLFGEAIAEGQQAVRIAAEVGALQLEEAANQQSRSDQQHQRQRELPRHQHCAQAMPRPADRSPAGRVLERFDERRLRSLSRRNYAENQAGEQGNGSAEEQHLPVHADRVQHGQPRGRHRHQHMHDAPRRARLPVLR